MKISTENLAEALFEICPPDRDWETTFCQGIT
jgi:hypothetical protein